MALTDDEAITLAALSGCGFWRPEGGHLWYPMEYTDHGSAAEKFEGHRRSMRGPIGCESMQELAHEWCRFFELDAHSRATTIP